MVERIKLLENKNKIQMQEPVWVTIGNTFVNATYGRPLRKHRVATIKSKWDTDKIGSIILYTTDYEKFEIIDGQHRIQAMIELFGNGAKVLATVFDNNMSIQERADFYESYNNERASLSAVETFVAKITAEDEDATNILKISRENNVKIVGIDVKSKALKFARCNSVSLIQKIYNVGVLNLTLKTLYNAYKNTDEIFSKESHGYYILQQVSNVIKIYQAEIDLKRLEKVLGKASSSSLNLRVTHESAVKTNAGALRIVEAYNKKLKNNRLDESKLFKTYSGRFRLNKKG